MSVHFLTLNVGSAGVSGSRPLDTAHVVILGQGTYNAELDYADGHVVQPRRESEPSADITIGLLDQGIWVMLLGFAGFCAAVLQRSRKNRLASALGED